MKVLHVVCEYPSISRPFANTFIKSQVDSLKNEAVSSDVYDIKGNRSIFNYFTSVPKIRKVVKSKNIDILHSHYSYAGFSSLFSNSNIPMVLSLMGSDLLGVPNEKGKLKIRGKIDIKLTNFITERVNHIIVKSSEMKGLIKSEVPISVIPNGINTTHFKYYGSNTARKELNLNDEDFIILFLGNPNNPRKNYKLAQNSVQKFFKDYSNVKLVNPYGISSEMVVSYMNAANVLLLTSFWEGSPNVVKEAMACNLPIISTNVGDVKEIIKNTKNCFIVNYDENEIIDKLILIFLNRERSNGTENIQHLRNEKIAEKIIYIYKGLIN